MGLWLEQYVWDDSTNTDHLIFRGRFVHGEVQLERLPSAPVLFEAPPPITRDEAIRLARRNNQYVLRCTSSVQDRELAGVPDLAKLLFGDDSE